MKQINLQTSNIRNLNHLRPWIVVWLFTVIVSAWWGIAPQALFASSMQARTIMEAVNARNDGDSSIAQLEMVLIEPGGQRRERRIKSYSLDRGADILKIMFFKAPADVKRTGFLTYDYASSGKDDDQWIYLPALRKTKRIASSDKSGSFMGSDFAMKFINRREFMVGGGFRMEATTLIANSANLDRLAFAIWPVKPIKISSQPLPPSPECLSMCTQREQFSPCGQRSAS